MTPKRTDGDRAPLPGVQGMDVANDDGNPFMSEASLPEAGGAAAAPIDDPLLLIVPEPSPPPRPSTMQRRLTAVTSLPTPTEGKRFRLLPQAVIQTASLIGAGVIVGVAITLFTISPGPAGTGQASSERRSGATSVLIATSLSERSHVPFASFGSYGEVSTPVLPADVTAPVIDSALVANSSPVPPVKPETFGTEVLPAPAPLVAEIPRKVDAAIPAEVRPAATASSETKPTASPIQPTVADSRPRLSDIKLPAANGKSALAEAKPTLAEARPPRSDIKPPPPEAKPTLVEPRPTQVEPTTTLAESRPTPEARPTPVEVRPLLPAVSRSTDAASPVREPAIARVERPVPPSVPAATANAAASNSDRQAVDSLLNVYKESYTRRDASLLAAVWRGVETDKLARAFESVATQELKFYRCKVSMEDARATASCLGRLVFVPRVGAPYPRERGLTYAFEFSRNEGRWLIDRVKIE
jgi:hypothetical protein